MIFLVAKHIKVRHAAYGEGQAGTQGNLSNDVSYCCTGTGKTCFNFRLSPRAKPLIADEV